ncbi:hypothetical protein NC651_021998 [Populus alba x Populus x berolinensis]|nr:hypothetical protein NC651_021998 [Populus alba x Populus x berolinensis]
MIATVITVVEMVDFASGLPGNRAKANMDEKIQDFEPFHLLGPTKLSISFNTHTNIEFAAMVNEQKRLGIIYKLSETLSSRRKIYPHLKIAGLQQGEFRLTHHHVELACREQRQAGPN